MRNDNDRRGHLSHVKKIALPPGFFPRVADVGKKKTMQIEILTSSL